MMQERVLRRPHSSAEIAPFAENSLDRSYQLKKDVVFGFDDIVGRTRFADRLFRMDRNSLDRLKGRLGEETVAPLERAIVDSRWQNMRGSALALGGQTATTAALAIPGTPPGAIFGTLGLAQLGAEINSHDLNMAYVRVKNAALPVVEKLYLDYLPDFHRWSEGKKRAFVADVSDGIALGESLPNPYTGAFSWALLTFATLHATGRGDIANTLAAGQGVSLGIQDWMLKKTQSTVNEVNARISKIVDMIAIDERLYAEMKKLIPYSGLYKEAENEWAGVNVLFSLLKFASKMGPLGVALLQNVQGLALSLFSQLSSQLDSLNSNKYYYASAKAGVATLKEALDLIDRNKISILSEQSMDEHLSSFNTQFPQEAEHQLSSEWEDQDTILELAPFELRFPHNKYTLLRRKKPLFMKKGIYIMSASAREGESAFLHLLNHHFNYDEKGESFIRLKRDAVPSGLHTLDSIEIKSLFRFVHPEPFYNTLSPAALFTDDLRRFIPKGVTTNTTVDELFRRFHSGEGLLGDEEHAFNLALQCIAGYDNEDAIYKRKLPVEVSRVLHLILPYLRPYVINSQLADEMRVLTEAIEKPKDKQLFYHYIHKDEELQEERDELVEMAHTHDYSSLPKSTRAKIRILRTLIEAASNGTKVITFDSTFDAISEVESRREREAWITLLTKFCESNDVVIVVATDQESQTKKYLRSSPAYQSDLFIHNAFLTDHRKNPSEK